MPAGNSSIVYKHTLTSCTQMLPFSSRRTRLELADEQTGREEADALGEDVLGHNVDERGQQDEGHGGLVDEEEGDELRHGRLEDRLFAGRLRVSGAALSVSPVLLLGRAHHLLGSGLLLGLGLAGDEGRARHDRGADGLAEGGPGERAEKACGVYRGLCGRCGLARGCGASIGAEEVLARESAYRMEVRKPWEMDLDGQVGLRMAGVEDGAYV